MNRTQAIEMKAAFTSIGGFTRIECEHRGNPTSDAETDPQWRINLWSVNAKAGNRNLEVVTDYSSDASVIARIARKAKGQATAADKKACARIAAAAVQDRE